MWVNQRYHNWCGPTVLLNLQKYYRRDYFDEDWCAEQCHCESSKIGTPKIWMGRALCYMGAIYKWKVSAYHRKAINRAPWIHSFTSSKFCLVVHVKDATHWPRGHYMLITRDNERPRPFLCINYTEIDFLYRMTVCELKRFVSNDTTTTHIWTVAETR